MKKSSILKGSLLSLCVLFLFTQISNAQNSDFNLFYRTSFYGSTEGSMPFWLTANVNGKVDPNSSNFINEIGFSRRYEISQDLSFEAGSNLVGRLSENNSLHFTELYGSATYRAFRLDVGRFNQPIGLNNHSLSVGSMMMSTNAIPVTRITISNPEFVSAPFSDGFLEYKGMFSHGWFTEDRYVDDAYLHQKYLYLKFNIGKFSAIGGVVHNALWGGTSENPNIGRLPQSFSDYLRVVTGSSADPDSDAPGGEISNTIGNSIASYEFGATYDFENISLTATRVFFLEDGVSRRFRSPWDGSWGLNLVFKEQSRLLQAVTYEHINTRRQDSRAFQARGRANYYNHFLYQTGWSNYGRVLGIPLITYNPETDRIDNNILVGHHLGATGFLNNNLEYKVFATYTRNYGIVGGKVPPETIDFPSRREDQYSFLVALNYRVPGTTAMSVGLSLSADTGEMYRENLGLMAGLTWNFR